SDRALSNGAGSAFRSIHTQPMADTTDWRGNVGWNDGHVTFENTHTVRTRHGNTRTDRDNLFTGDNLSNARNNYNVDALMVYHFLGRAGNDPHVQEAFKTSATTSASGVSPF